VAITPPQWRWQKSAQIDARIEGMDGAPHDHCRCAMQLAVVYRSVSAAHLCGPRRETFGV